MMECFDPFILVIHIEIYIHLCSLTMKIKRLHIWNVSFRVVFFPIPSDPQILQIQELGGDAWHLSSLEAQEGIH